MIPSVADKTPIPAQVRRHTDPPGFWVAVFVGSVSLHLLAFWLLYSFGFSRLWPQQDQASIPIEIVEISSQTKTKVRTPAFKPKSVSPKPTSKNQNFPAKNLSKQVDSQNKLTAKSTPHFQDSSTIAVTKNQKAIAQQRQQQLAQQRQQQLVQQRQQQLVQQRQQQLAQQRQQQLAQQRQQQLVQQRQQQLAQQRQQELAQQRQQQLAQQRQQQLAQQQEPRGEQLQPPKTQSQGGLFAFWVPLSQEQQRALMLRDPLPKNLKLAEHIGSNEKAINSLYINSNLELPAVEFLVSLVIDNTGKFVGAKVIDKAIPEAEKSKYEQFANDIFQGEKFQPAHYLDGTTPPELSNRFVRIKIERR